jgi:hypothetical protein
MYSGMCPVIIMAYEYPTVFLIQGFKKEMPLLLKITMMGLYTILLLIYAIPLGYSKIKGY